MVALLLLASTVPASAQSSLSDKAVAKLKRVGIHLNAGLRHPLDEGVESGGILGLSVGLSPSGDGGWSIPFSINWSSADLVQNEIHFATIRSYYVLSGVSYSVRRSRWSVGAAMEGGLAVNRARLEPRAQEAFGVPNTVVRINRKNSMVLRPQIKAEYFLTRMISLRTSLKYLFTEPDVEIETVNGRLPGRWNTHYVNLNFGVGLYPFRKASAEAQPTAPPPD